MERLVHAIEGYPGYFISNYGEVYSAWDRSAGAIGKSGKGGVIGVSLKRLKSISQDGRWVVGLSRNGKRRTARIHTLVLNAFVGKCPVGMQACHFPDRNTANNRLDNLRWDTPKSNAADKVFHKTTNDGERNGSAKLTEKQVILILSRRKIGETYQSLADKFGVSLAAIQQICKGKTWKTVLRG